MKYLKTYENLSEYIVLDLTKNITLETYKSIPRQQGGYFSNAKEIIIYIDHILISTMNIDERGFNTIRRGNFYNLPKFNETLHDYVIKLNNSIQDYLIEAHKKMKYSNPKYGTYNSKTRTGREGELGLMTHDFFDFVKNDFKTSNSPLIETIKDMDKNFIFYKDASKYNI